LFGFDEASKVFLYAQPTDMRKGFDGLYGVSPRPTTPPKSQEKDPVIY